MVLLGVLLVFTPKNATKNIKKRGASQLASCRLRHRVIFFITSYTTKLILLILSTCLRQMALVLHNPWLFKIPPRLDYEMFAPKGYSRAFS